jgi:hypothetical protein
MIATLASRRSGRGGRRRLCGPVCGASGRIHATAITDTTAPPAPFVLPNAPITEGLHGAIVHLVSIGLIGCIAWSIVAFVDVLEDLMSARSPMPHSRAAARVH